MFWDKEEIRIKFIDDEFCCQDSTTKAEKSTDDEEIIEVGFVMVFLKC